MRGENLELGDLIHAKKLPLLLIVVVFEARNSHRCLRIGDFSSPAAVPWNGCCAADFFCTAIAVPVSAPACCSRRLWLDHEIRISTTVATAPFAAGITTRAIIAWGIIARSVIA